jgi:predicted nucleotidyltransferase
MFGLKNSNLIEIRSLLSKFPEIKEVKIFGSRAKGNYKNGSDVDIVLIGDKVTRKIALDISFELNEDTLMPYKFDILNINDIENLELLNHFVRKGITFYKNSTSISS